MQTFAHLEQSPNWEDKTAVPSVDKLPLTHSTRQVGNRRDVLMSAAQPFAGTLYVLRLASQPGISTAEIEMQRQADSTNANAFESDLKHIALNKKGQECVWDGSFQLYLAKNSAQVWAPAVNGAKAHWLDTGIKPNVDPTELNHIKVEYLFLDDRIVYVAVSINGDRFPIGADFPVLSSNWTLGEYLQIQNAVVSASAAQPASLMDSVYNLALRTN